MASEVLKNLYVVVPLFKILYGDRTYLRGWGEVRMIPAVCPVTILWLLMNYMNFYYFRVFGTYCYCVIYIGRDGWLSCR